MLLSSLAWTGAAILSVPVLVFTAETLAGLKPVPHPVPVGRRPRIAVLVPAHDEEAGIAATLRGLRRELAEGDRLCVIADNCTDRTAEIASAFATDVFARVDPERRGKGYALSYGLDRLRADPPDVVIVVDADCTVAPGALVTLARWAEKTGRPVQAEYLLEAPANPSPKTRISAFAFLVRNRVRAAGLDRAGLPCQLTGSGMAFSWEAINLARPTHGNVVEDMAMGLDLALQGRPPLFCAAARVRSLLPSSEAAATTQRRRWEGGHLATLRAEVPRLLKAALAEQRTDLLALALDLAVPPLALLTLGTTAAAGAAWGAVVFGVASGPALLLSGELGLLALAVGAAWVHHGREVLPLRHALQIPLYVAWKVPTYVAALGRRTAQGWVRTRRDAEL